MTVRDLPEYATLLIEEPDDDILQNLHALPSK